MTQIKVLEGHCYVMESLLCNSGSQEVERRPPPTNPHFIHRMSTRQLDLFVGSNGPGKEISFNITHNLLVYLEENRSLESFSNFMRSQNKQVGNLQPMGEASKLCVVAQKVLKRIVKYAVATSFKATTFKAAFELVYGLKNKTPTSLKEDSSLSHLKPPVIDYPFVLLTPNSFKLLKLNLFHHTKGCSLGHIGRSIWATIINVRMQFLEQKGYLQFWVYHLHSQPEVKVLAYKLNN